MNNPCVNLQVCQDGVWAHFHVPGGVYWMTNLSVQGRMASLFGSQYREWAARQPTPVVLDTFDEYDLCDAWMGLPVEFFNPGPDFGLPPADDLWRRAVANMARPGDVANLVMQRDALHKALALLLDDVEACVDHGMPFADPAHGFHESVMAAREALKR